MREPHKDPKRLADILEAIDNIFQYVGNDDMEAFVADHMRYHAVVYNIMIIGEAANMLTKDFRDEHPEVPWRDIIDMRNVLVHGYYVASPRFVWETYTKDLVYLKERVDAYIGDFRKDD